MGRLKFCLFFPLFMGLMAASLPGQAPTAKIFGTVMDEQGTPLPGVSVEASSPKLVGKAAAQSDEKGVYRIFALTPGLYKITFSLPGFKTVTREGIIVEVEQSVKLNVVLALGALNEQVTVIGQSPLIDVKSTVKGTTITKAVFELLPKGRDFDSLAIAVPGVQKEPMLSGFSVDGASGAENMFYVDGTDITNIYTGVRGQSVVFEFIDEVQVKASGYQAEYGGSLGGVIHVITRQGGNELHGDVIGYYSGSRLNGKERDTLRLGLYDTTVAEYVNYQDLYGKDRIDRFETGFNLGGYILKDRLWFYGALLPVLNTTTRHVRFEPSLLEGDYTRRDQSWDAQVKLTAQPFKFMRLGASFISNYQSYKGDVPPRDGTGSPTDRWADYGYRYPNWTASGYVDFTLGNNLLLSLRGGSFYNNTTGQLVQPTEPRYTHSGLGNSIYPDIPADYIRPRGWSNMPSSALNVTNRKQAQKSYLGGDLTYYLDFLGEHALKFGAQWVRTAEDFQNGYKYPDYPSITFVWGRPFVYLGQNYGQGAYGYYTVYGNAATGPIGYFYNVHADRWSIYLQDSWTIKDRLTLNLGLRAESEYIPSYSSKPEFRDQKPIHFDFSDKLAPRIGFVYDVTGDAGLKIFGSYGVYYDVMKLYTAAAYFGGGTNVAAVYQLDTYAWDQIGKNGAYPGALIRTIDFLPVNFGIVDPNLKPMSQREISFGVEKKIAENVSATARLVQKHLLYAIEDAGVISGGNVAYYLTNPGYGYSRSTADGGKFDAKYPACPKAKREYWGLNFSLDKRLSDNWMASFSYTWSRLTGNYSGLASSDEFSSAGGGRNSPNAEGNFDTWYLAYDKALNPIDGPLATDRPHVFKLFGAYSLPFGLTMGVLVSGMSGTPVTEYWNLSGNFMPYNRGNLGRTPFLWFANLFAEFSLRLGGTKLRCNINIDNVFDTSTVVAYYPYRNISSLAVTEAQILSKDWQLETSNYIPNPQFRKPAWFFPPISARLGVRYSF